MPNLAPMTATTFYLSILAYTDETARPLESQASQEQRMFDDINTQLAALGKQGAIATGWEVVWGPALGDGRANMMFVAANAAAGQYAVVIRGTDVRQFMDLFEDLKTRKQVAYPYLSGANIANGTNDALGVLQGMQGVTNGDFPSGPTSSLEDFLETLPSTAAVFVTGHSLGGALSTVLAPWIASFFPPANVQVYTYAAPTAGDANFASAFNTMFDASAATPRTYRFYNSIDVVPNAWATLPAIEALYPQPGPAAGFGVKHVISCALKNLPAYVQVGVPGTASVIELPGTPIAIINPPAGASDANVSIHDPSFESEALLQHSGPTYQNLLGLGSVSFATLKFTARGAQ